MRLPGVLRTRSRLQLGLAASGLVVGALLFWILLGNPALTAWVALALAIPALATGVTMMHKARVLEFRPEVLAGDVILPRASRTKGGAKLLLPLQFSNSGYADGIIEWVAIRVTLDGQADRSVLLSPVAEVDMAGFLQAQRQLTAANTIDPFTAFALEGKRSLAKFVLFDVAERSRAQPLELRPGRYAFELFLKVSNCRQPRFERCFEHVLDERQIEQYRGDATVYLINYNLTLPAIRRQLSGGEWLPREGRLAG